MNTSWGSMVAVVGMVVGSASVAQADHFDGRGPRAGVVFQLGGLQFGISKHSDGRYGFGSVGPGFSNHGQAPCHKPVVPPCNHRQSFDNGFSNYPTPYGYQGAYNSGYGYNPQYVDPRFQTPSNPSHCDKGYGGSYGRPGYDRGWGRDNYNHRLPY